MTTTNIRRDFTGDRTKDVPELTTPRYRATLEDFDGNPIPLVNVSTLTLTLYDESTGVIVNGVDSVNILNADRGTFGVTDGKLTILLEEDDTEILDDTKGSEKRVMLIEWVAGAIIGKHEVVFRVKNLARVP